MAWDSMYSSVFHVHLASLTTLRENDKLKQKRETSSELLVAGEKLFLAGNRARLCLD